MHERRLPRLVCLPYAGGGQHIFQPWVSALKSRVEVVCPLLPGRGSRTFEPALTSVASQVDWLRRNLKPQWHGRVAIWGHSMGALLGYELCRALAEDGLDPPVHLFASGRLPPHRPRRLDQYHLADDDGLIARLHELGGIHPEVLADRDLMSLLLPTIRADVTACETYRWPPDRAPLNVPVTVIGGDADPDVPANDLAAWRELTLAPCRIEVLAGGHFFINDHVERLADLFVDTLGSNAGPPAAVAGATRPSVPV